MMIIYHHHYHQLSRFTLTLQCKCTEAARNCVSIDRFTWYSNVYLYVVVKEIVPRNSVNVFNKAKTTVIYWVWGEKKEKLGFEIFPHVKPVLTGLMTTCFPPYLSAKQTFCNANWKWIDHLIFTTHLFLRYLDQKIMINWC